MDERFVCKLEKFRMAVANASMVIQLFQNMPKVKQD